MKYAICSVAAAPIRRENAHRSEMTSQLLFGEAVRILQSKEEWRHVQCIHDGYEGWLTEHLVTETDAATALQPPAFVSTGILNHLVQQDDVVPVPMGVSLPGFDVNSKTLWNNFQYSGSYRETNAPCSRDEFQALLQPWLNAPYLWGGRTFMGVDCSGFVQTVFKILGVPLLRDAWQQAGQGTAVDLQQSRLGDLAFFHNDAGKIVHVGIVMERHKIMHASGKVRIDTLTKEGIIHNASGKKTHALHSIKRLSEFPG